MAKKLINLDDLGAGAPLKEVAAVTDSNKGKIPTKAKNIQNMPLEFFTRHAALREQGKTSLLFTPYIIATLMPTQSLQLGLVLLTSSEICVAMEQQH